MKVFRVGLALKPTLFSKDLASQFERYTPQRDVNQLGNVCLWQRQCHDTILRTIDTFDYIYLYKSFLCHYSAMKVLKMDFVDILKWS